MIGFDLSEVHLSVQELVRQFVSREVLPEIGRNDSEGRFDRSLLPKMARLGLLGLCIPPATAVSISTTSAWGWPARIWNTGTPPCGSILSVHLALHGLTLLSWGSEEQKERWLKPQARGEKLATFGLTEPDAGSDVVGIRTTAWRDGAHYILNGEKTWISLADVADHFLVFAWTDPGQTGATGPPRFERLPGGTLHEGVFQRDPPPEVGYSGRNTGYFSLQDVRVPAANRLGKEGEGFKIAMFALEQGRYTVAAGATGLIRACLDASRKYALGRRTFEVPIARHQLVKEMIAGMVRDYETSRLLWLRCGWLKNQGGATTARPPWPSGTPPWPRSGPPPTRSRSTAPTASRTSIRWVATTGTARGR